ncbi:hypothetical protein L208DRAFT_1555197, partial [Tricholoma matsutake]
IPGQQTTPQPPIIVEGAPEYVVEEILASCLRQKKLKLLIKWKNYTDKNNLWEPKENCKRARNMITQFFKCNLNALHHIARMVYEGMRFWPYQNFMEGTDTIFSCLEVEA